MDDEAISIRTSSKKKKKKKVQPMAAATTQGFMWTLFNQEVQHNVV